MCERNARIIISACVCSWKCTVSKANGSLLFAFNDDGGLLASFADVRREVGAT